MRLHGGGGTRKSVLFGSEVNKSKSSGEMMSFGLGQRVEREASSPSEMSLAEWSLTLNSSRGYESCRCGKVYAWRSILWALIPLDECYASSRERTPAGEIGGAGWEKRGGRGEGGCHAGSSKSEAP
jgi:hypothetical protein